MKADFSRRRFLAAGAAVTALPHLPDLFAKTIIVEPDETWARKTKRWAQLTLAEDDAAKFDLDFWLNYFRKTKSDGLCFSAGGCVASLLESVTRRGAAILAHFNEFSRPNPSIDFSCLSLME